MTASARTSNFLELNLMEILGNSSPRHVQKVIKELGGFSVFTSDWLQASLPLGRWVRTHILCHAVATLCYSSNKLQHTCILTQKHDA